MYAFLTKFPVYYNSYNATLSFLNGSQWHSTPLWVFITRLWVSVKICNTVFMISYLPTKTRQKVVSYKSTHTAWVGNGLNFRETLHWAKNAYAEAHARPKIPIDKIVLVPRSLRMKTLFHRKLEKMHVMIEEESFTLSLSPKSCHS